MERFYFDGFEPDETLRLKAERALDRISERSPSDASITARLQQVAGAFRCTVEIGSLSCPLSVEETHRIPAVAIDRAEFGVMRRLGRWRGVRFITAESAPIKPLLTPAP
jgi:hypothetical protein